MKDEKAEESSQTIQYQKNFIEMTKGHLSEKDKKLEEFNVMLQVKNPNFSKCISFTNFYRSLLIPQLIISLPTVHCSSQISQFDFSFPSPMAACYDSNGKSKLYTFLIIQSHSKILTNFIFKF